MMTGKSSNLKKYFQRGKRKNEQHWGKGGKKWKKGEGNGCRPGQILRCRVNETLHEYPITSIYNLSITWKGILQS
jgi:hypothetical protein